MQTVEVDFFERLDKLNTYRKGNQRAPHKPLYILYLIASIQQGQPRLHKFASIEANLVEALQRFGLANKSQHAHYPFWRLQNDNIAEVSPKSGYDLRASNSDPKKSSLLKLNAAGGFVESYFDLLSGDLSIQSKAIRKLLDAHFPPSIHEEIILFFNLRVEGARSGDVHSDSEFRTNLLSSYGNKCALTGYSLHFRGEFPGLEAAHLCWPQAGGNDDVSNGILMTTLCRKLFHLGIIGVEPNDLRIVISDQAADLGLRSAQLSKSLHKKLSLPTGINCHPSIENLAWHKRWVFRN
jgi:putative restriction endonuclease